MARVTGEVSDSDLVLFLCIYLLVSGDIHTYIHTSHMCVFMVEYALKEARGGLCFISLRQSLSLNQELGWQPGITHISVLTLLGSQPGGHAWPFTWVLGI